MCEVYPYKAGKNKYICFLVVHLDLVQTKPCVQNNLSDLVLQCTLSVTSLYLYTASFDLQFSKPVSFILQKYLLCCKHKNMGVRNTSSIEYSS